MANSKGSSNFRNFMYAGQQSLLPPRIPFPSVSPSYLDYGSSSAVISKGGPKPRQGLKHHQRTSSESFLIEEQPSWVEELLNEPETPVRRGHRRSSSDSFAYLDAANASNMDIIVQEDYKFKNIASLPRRGSGDFDHFKDVNHASFYPELNSFIRQQDRAWEPSMNSMAYSGGLPSAGDNIILPSSGFSCPPQEPAEISSTPAAKQDQEDFGPHDPKVSSERRDFSNTKPSASETDPKRAKQQFAQRSRVRKLQYIAELERNVQSLQVEGSEVAAEIEFLDQQSLILNMENKALKQRLDGLAQEQLIKCLEQEMLEREIARLRVLYQQQQLQQQQPQQQRPLSSHRRSNSRDHLNLDAQFASLSLKHEAGSGRDPVSGPLRI
ncbi:Basic-leucine zipper domain [Macleaya cordata]|uniref:Basic-leucine zipper domain n=1 Tax=Macleaya cordata TaxID=56857 RepID=A0A200PMG9_MACCD|nr:Basic-leucine zipper domain [Macleaya cordata]